jgi:hypothetical protein
VDEPCGLKGVAAAAHGDVAVGYAAQLVVDERHEPIERGLAFAAQLRENIDLATRRAHRGSSMSAMSEFSRTRSNRI